MRLQHWPLDALGPNFLVREKGADPQKVAVGLIVLHGIEAGEPITPQRLLKPGESGFLAAALTPGMRAVTIKIDALSAEAGFILPEDRVDVVLNEHYTLTLAPVTQQASQKIGQLSTKDVSSVILRNVKVLAIDQGMQDIDSKPKVGATATLEVDLEEAQKVAVAAQLGTLSLVLRSHTIPAVTRPEPASPIVEDFEVSPFRASLIRQIYSNLAVTQQQALQQQNSPSGGGEMRVYHGAAARRRATIDACEPAPDPFVLVIALAAALAGVVRGGAERRRPDARSTSIAASPRSFVSTRPGARRSGREALPSPTWCCARADTAFVIARDVGETNVYFFDAEGREIDEVDITVRFDADAISTALRRAIPNEAIGVSTANKSIVLSGSVVSQTELENAQTIVRQFDGRRQIDRQPAHGPRSEPGAAARSRHRDAAQHGEGAGHHAGLSRAAAVQFRRPGLRPCRYADDARHDPLRQHILRPAGRVPPRPSPAHGDRRLKELHCADPGARTERHGQDAGRAQPHRGLGRDRVVPRRRQVPAAERRRRRLERAGRAGVLSLRRAAHLHARRAVERPHQPPHRHHRERRPRHPPRSAARPCHRSPSAAPRRRSKLPSGGSVAIAGLLQNDLTNSINGLPGVMDLPILGALFSSKQFQHNETDLVIAVTAFLIRPVDPNSIVFPSDGFGPASDFNMYFLGRLNATYTKPAPGRPREPVPPLGPAFGPKGPFGFILE